jgi:hypothetical protein
MKEEQFPKIKYRSCNVPKCHATPLEFSRGCHWSSSTIINESNWFCRLARSLIAADADRLLSTPNYATLICREVDCGVS